MAIEVTDELRRAVYAADCERLGHWYDMGAIVGHTDDVLPENPTGLPTAVLRAPDPTQMPHLLCRRCGKVWLVIDEPGDGYDDAVEKVTRRMGGPTLPAEALKPRRPRGVFTRDELEERGKQRQRAALEQIGLDPDDPNVPSHGHGH